MGTNQDVFFLVVSLVELASFCILGVELFVFIVFVLGKRSKYFKFLERRARGIAEQPNPSSDGDDSQHRQQSSTSSSPSSELMAHRSWTSTSIRFTLSLDMYEIRTVSGVCIFSICSTSLSMRAYIDA